ncbi:UDP-N-acetylmuramoyl-tripeptide--D-alanyl-D-alanine ligase [Bifidobacterium eulemuris]|uniref:UDP-N-acetylmuramoyl-tripeptide--D-alanyl-D-alanine ligase n=1 Tax=Bifidobacterium eulemuris TaxID=1765219 RepID=A0A261G7I7_9BIFI|nr:UDP-N-acetylmuramoyl-tripeptide--D-alanyl-D-alanine ligase [Bifidobacterium eulemuris]OZG67382.1 UDP-N-acetylmuramoyl-tripeptide--D-alanyl-D- alan ine ligase [Bifidobacterium eulemuris]QOL32953.1 UDP-N-acetylmuramoyl-tripeptide--D-alanyl-D-alanine ligase [Bifidobacterium eulemuris]
MVPMSVETIAQAVSGRLVLPSSQDASALGIAAVSDSRQISEGSVFVAIKGERVDGHDFVPSVAQAGAVAAIVDHPVDGARVAQIVVDDTVAALGALAAHNIAMRKAMDEPFDIVGLTGSVGKTTTKDLLSALLERVGKTVAPVGSFNNEIGLPLTALKVDRDTRFFVAEMGANHLGEIANLTRIAPPEVAIVLKVGVAHLGEFGSRQIVAQAKSEIVRGLVPGGIAVLNADDEYAAAMADIAPGEVRWFGIDHTDAAHTVSATDITMDERDRAGFVMRTPDGETPVRLGISGRHNVMNALAAASVALHFGMSPAEIAETLGTQRRISPHRMAVSQVTRGAAEFTLIDDSFNANPDSMKAGLDGLASWGAGKPLYRVAVLGAMLELGDDGPDLHAQVGSYAASLGVDALIAVGGAGDGDLDALAEALANGAKKERSDARGGKGSIDLVSDIDRADRLVSDMAAAHPDVVVLLKGSHASGLSALAERWTAGTNNR